MNMERDLQLFKGTSKYSKRPKNVTNANGMSKETFNYEKRPSKETFKSELQKRPTKETYKRDLYIWKETYIQKNCTS